MPTTVFSQALTSNDSGNNGQSFRTPVPSSAGSLGQVRVTFQSGSATWVVAHASIGVSVQASFGAGAWQVAATPIELTFIGVSGFSLLSSSTLISDWVNLSWTNGQMLVVIIDITSGNEEIATGVTNAGLFTAAATTYNQANPAGYSGGGISGFVAGFNLIETQAVAGGSPLRRNSSMDGLGASGGFFSNPLARSVLGWRPSIVTARRKLIVPELRLAA